ncbi:MAG: recombinase family protein [Lachnospiraceae bacterium]|nr:recombinase family protein [Lachnospiraceae bacterium]
MDHDKKKAGYSTWNRQTMGDSTRDTVHNRIEVIPAFRKPRTLAPEYQRRRVAAYCRVSTNMTEQESSIENQREHYETYIASRPEWIPAGVYWETGVTGTRQEARPELARLMEDSSKGRIDLILTKSISRFSRNTADCLELVRKLNAMGVQILFEKENIYTGTAESELMLTLFASMAEAESHSISANLTWAIEKRFQDGSFRYSRAPYGYRLEDGTFVVDPDTAGIIREIYGMVLRGEGAYRIAKELNRRGIPTGTVRRDGTPGRWTSFMVKGIITNVLYTGDALMQKTWHDRYFRCRPNHGEKPMYYVEEHHEPIIDRKHFMNAVLSSRQRGVEKGVRVRDLTEFGLDAGSQEEPEYEEYQDERDEGRRGGLKRYVLSGLMVCGCCGAPMRRVSQKTAGGKRHHWACLRHLESREICGMKRIPEQDVMNAFMTMMNKLAFAPDAVLGTYAAALQRDGERSNIDRIHELEKQGLKCTKERLHLREVLGRGRGDQHGYGRRIMEIEAEEAFIRETLRKLRLEAGSAGIGAVRAFRQQLEDWRKLGEENAGQQGTVDAQQSDMDLLPAAEELLPGIVEQITVRTEKELVFRLSCGFCLTETLE